MSITGSEDELYTVNLWNVTEPIMLLEEIDLIKNLELRRRNNRDAQIAYLCLVFLVCLMLLCLYLLRGFHSRNTYKRDHSLHYMEHLPYVNDVVLAKAKYLPMFHKENLFTTVYVHDCGTDP
nr:hypothetical protein BgiMline_013808 [Biomphalaria glabrata]